MQIISIFFHYFSGLLIAVGLINPSPQTLATSTTAIEAPKPIIAPSKAEKPIIQSRSVPTSLRVPSEPVAVPPLLTNPTIYYKTYQEPDMTKKTIAPAQVEPVPTAEPTLEAPKSTPARFQLTIEPYVYPGGYKLVNDGYGTKMAVLELNEAIVSDDITVEIYTKEPGLSFTGMSLGGVVMEEVSTTFFRLPIGAVLNPGTIELKKLAEGTYTVEVKVKSVQHTCGNCDYPTLPIEFRIEVQP